MPIYDRPTKTLMQDWARDHLTKGQVFERSAPMQWFKQHYPKIKQNTVSLHVEGMSVNSRSRRHHANVKPGSGHDLFFKLGPSQFRLWDPGSDPAPIYRETITNQNSDDPGALQSEINNNEGSREFAFEKDLQNYLAKNLSLIEPGLQLYEEEGITGLEYDAGGRFIDILAVDKNDAFVVVELKVSKGYDRVVGQLLRYIGWVEKNLEPTQAVRGVIVASEITSDLRLACSRIPSVHLFEYEISLKLRPV